MLGICLGLQLALDWSDEDGGVEGLGLLPGRSERLVGGRVPRMGWSVVEPFGDAFYFAHSYAAVTPGATAWAEGAVAEARAPRVYRLPVPSGEERPRGRPLPGRRARGGRAPRPSDPVSRRRRRAGRQRRALPGACATWATRSSLALPIRRPGADELVFLDIRATLDGRQTLVDLVARVAEQLAIPFTVGRRGALGGRCG